MKKLFIVLLTAACIFCLLPAGASSTSYAMSNSSDTTDTQKNMLKKQGPKHRIKEHKPAQDTRIPVKPDSLIRTLDAPLLRLKDSTQHIAQ